MWKYIFEITPCENGEKKTITIMDKRGYDYDVNKRIRDMIELYWNGKATWERVKKEEVK